MAKQKLTKNNVINVITNPVLKEPISSTKEKLFSVIPTINSDLKTNGTALSFVSNEYHKLFKKISATSGIIAPDTDPLPVCVNKSMEITKNMVNDCIDSMRADLKKVNGQKKRVITTFLDRFENKLMNTINYRSASVLCQVLNEMVCESYILSLKNIISILCNDDECASIAPGTIVHLKSMIDTIAANFSTDYGTNNILIKLFNNCPIFYNHSMIDNYNEGYYPKDDIGKNAKDLDHIIDYNSGANLAANEFYYKIRRILLANTDYTILCSNGMPLYLSILALLDGSGVFHMFHEMIISIYEYADTMVEIYKSEGIISNADDLNRYGNYYGDYDEDDDY